MFLVVIGHAPTGLAFVGPFGTEAEGERWVTEWKATAGRENIPIGVIQPEPPTNKAAGANLAGR